MNIDLLASLKNGTHSAMEQIYHSHWEQVFDAAFKKLGDEDLAQDITQEIFISLWENRTHLKIESNLSAYLHGAVKYKVINHFKSAALKDKQKTELALLMNEQFASATDGKLILSELNLEVEAAIELLPEKMRMVFSMSRKQEKSIKEIATELDISVQTVKNQISAAMKLLKKSLSYIAFLAVLLALI
ncbi:RNA polymerase sigma-70 factor [Pedobacter nototheniae]|uniref:RNA polymerase sigma factor n=1 Tax=Pedobacter nototheniae TaxID=2488994 RepID=UPI0029303495|nr:RNA polymerase sigma-70 factor [Pedobacter nototheniae]